MFNTIGYFNYRYFCNFLFFVFIGMFYGAILTFTPFQESNSHNYFKQKQHARRHHLDEEEAQHLYPWTPLPDEKTAIGFSFILCLSVGIAVLCLLGFHIYLLFTAQTTIEFHANVAHRRRAKRLRRQWINPYDFGWKRNWQQVYGTGNPVLALFVPSSREPEFLPVPFAGDRGRRHPKEEHADLLNENERRRNSGANVV
jgi:palmitoyltransferase